MTIRFAARLAGTLLYALGATTAAQSLSAEDFARRAELHSVTLSPGGDYVAIAIPTDDGMETRLNIVSLDGSGHTQVLRFGPQQHVSDILWTSDEQVVVSRAKLQPLKATPESYGELMSSDVHGENQETLFAYVPDRAGRRGRRKDKGFADVAHVLPNDPGMVMVRFRCWRSVCGEEPPTTVYRVDTRTGEREEVERVDEPAWFGFDQTGRARILVTWDEADQPVLRYRPGASDEWLPMPEALAGRTIEYAWFAADGNTVYLTASDAGEPAQLYKADFAAGSRVKLAGRDDVDIARVMRAGFAGEPFAVVYDEDKPSVHYLDQESEWAQMHVGLLRKFPGHMVSLLDSTRDDTKVLFSAWSGRDPGGWYLFDRAANKLQLVAPSRPWIDPAEMAPVRPISFQAADGTTLHGFLTGKGTGPQPLVVMPHGGPFGPYDSWQYDAQAQFLASRGYSVLQVNYRGSGGRGETMMRSGYKEWGGLIQDDIADGVRWAIAQKLADPDRICTFGASFGGYSALMQPIRYPDLYKCAVGYAGVYDMNLMRKTDSFTNTQGTRRFFDRSLGTDPAELDAISPALRVDELEVPVMLVHGTEDHTANFDQYEAMLEALQDAGRTPETLVITGEGHGFRKPEHRAELFEKMAAFLDKHIGH